MASRYEDHPDYGAMGIFAGYGEYDAPIIKTNSGFSLESEFMTLEWDHHGKYRGQWQDDALGDEGRIFINAHPTGAQVDDLTQDQMDRARAIFAKATGA